MIRKGFWVVTGLVFLYILSAGGEAARLILLSVALLALITVLHEMGHFVAAKAMGHTVFEVVIGIGPAILQHTSGSTHYVLRLLPLGGAVASASTDLAHYRAKRLVIVAAGPLVNALIFVSAFVLHTRSGVWYELAYLNGLVLIENLLPFRVRTAQGRQATDGLAFIRLLRGESGAEEAAAAAFAIRAERARVAGDRATARQIAEEGLARFPESRALRSWVGTDLIASGDYRSGRECYLALLAEDGLEEAQEAIYRNNLAWSDLMLGDPALVAEAVEQSAAAIAALPKVDALQGTRGFALIEAGQVVEGLALCRQVTARQTDPKGKALNACTCAIGHARQWELAEALKYRAMAEGLDPACPLLDRARDEIAARKVTSLRGSPPAGTPT